MARPPADAVESPAAGSPFCSRLRVLRRRRRARRRRRRAGRKRRGGMRRRRRRPNAPGQKDKERRRHSRFRCVYRRLGDSRSMKCDLPKGADPLLLILISGHCVLHAHFTAPYGRWWRKEYNIGVMNIPVLYATLVIKISWHVAPNDGIISYPN